jgi:hypothetical protein
MAAPFIAGTSVLLREALQLAGASSITQDTINTIMRQTADSVFDPATGQSYLRINVGRALDSIMPADDYGSTAAAAYNLGTTSATNVAGLVGKLSDRDYFSFTASQSGSCKLTATITGELKANWDLVGGGGTVSGAGGNVLSFNVVAGQTYKVGLSTSAGLGRYSIALTVDPGTVNLGTVDFRQVDDLSVAGERWLSFTATRGGILSAEALFASAGGNVTLSVYNGAQQLLGTASAVAGGARLDLTATAGATYLVRLAGTNNNVDLRLTNLVARSGTLLSVMGTTGNDVLEVRAGLTTHQITINGVSYDEELLKFDDKKMFFRYRIVGDSPYPVTDYVSTMYVTKGTGGKTKVLWQGKFKNKPDSGKTDAEVIDLFNGTYKEGLDNLKALAEAS